jgi:hypothetical protein
VCFCWQVAYQLCIVDSVFDSSLTAAQCKKQSETGHHTVSQQKIHMLWHMAEVVDLEYEK